MKGLDRIADRIAAQLDEKDRVRELALKSARTITRLAGTALRGMHRGDDPGDPLVEAHAEVSKLRTLLADHPEFWHGGSVEGALQEVAEAAIVHALLRGKPLPDPDRLEVTGAAYILGLADAVGELRRFALDRMRAGEIDAAAEYLEAMEEIFDVLLRFDHPDAILPVRHKQDVARGLLERTRGELAVAAHSARLERRLRSAVRTR